MDIVVYKDDTGRPPSEPPAWVGEVWADDAGPDDDPLYVTGFCRTARAARREAMAWVGEHADAAR